MEELRDIYQHFMLYYSQDIPSMQDAWKRREREEAKAKRRQERLARRMERGEGEEGAEDEDVIEEEPLDDEEEEEDAQHESLKHASRGGTYALCRKAGLGMYADTTTPIYNYVYFTHFVQLPSPYPIP
jgi:transcription elongation factor SPT6